VKATPIPYKVHNSIFVFLAASAAASRAHKANPMIFTAGLVEKDQRERMSVRKFIDRIEDSLLVIPLLCSVRPTPEIFE
jgi:hypothetical protein